MRLLSIIAGAFTVGLLSAKAFVAAESCKNNGTPGACQHGSVCRLNSKGLIWCDKCPPQWTGNRCQTPRNAQSCKNNGTPGACQHGSVCRLNSKGLIWCDKCPPQWTGNRCQTPRNAQSCKNNGTPGACQHGSTCALNKEGKIYCKNCNTTKYWGSRCEKTKQSCANNGTPGQCKNGSTCALNAEYKIYCKNCPAGYSGSRCENPPKQTCVWDTCKNGGGCSLDAQSQIKCTCYGGYTGDRCQIKPAQSCAYANGGCLHGSSCVLDAELQVTCQGCPYPYSGDKCEIAPICEDSLLYEPANQYCECSSSAYTKVTMSIPEDYAGPQAGKVYNGCLKVCARPANLPPLVCQDQIGDYHTEGCVAGACKCTPSFEQYKAPCPVKYGDTFSTTKCLGCPLVAQRRSLRGSIMSTEQAATAAAAADGGAAFEYNTIPAQDFYAMLYPDKA